MLIAVPAETDPDTTAIETKTVAVGWGGATRASRCFARAPLSNMQVPDSAIF
jgi:hypothetical protein